MRADRDTVYNIAPQAISYLFAQPHGDVPDAGQTHMRRKYLHTCAFSSPKHSEPSSCRAYRTQCDIILEPIVCAENFQTII